MPHMIFKGVPQEKMLQMTPALLTKLSEAIGCPEDWLIIEGQSTTFYNRSGVDKNPMINVTTWWYPRSAAVQEATAMVLKEALNAQGFEAMQLVFSPIADGCFYEFE